MISTLDPPLMCRLEQADQLILRCAPREDGRALPRIYVKVTSMVVAVPAARQCGLTAVAAGICGQAFVSGPRRPNACVMASLKAIGEASANTARPAAEWLFGIARPLSWDMIFKRR
jgi:hypothetical protein